MLNHIAVLVFRDLTVREKKLKAQGEKAGVSKVGKKKGQENVNGGKPGENRDRTIYRSLPRIQSDRDLISEVSKGGTFTPRPVQLHPAWVRGAKEYFSAIQAYNEAQKRGASEAQLQQIATQLALAREKSYKASKEKLGTWPHRFEQKRVHVLDPVNGDERDLVTWVIFHVSPKPTEEEAKSQITIYERYYSRSSSLASLEQMKPWFVGLG